MIHSLSFRPILHTLLMVLVCLPIVPQPARAAAPALSLWTRNISEMTGDEPAGIEDSNPEIAVIGSTVHVMWMAYQPDTAQRLIYYRRSTDGGRNWESRKLLFSDDAADINASATLRRMAVDGNGIHIVTSSYGRANTWFGKLIYLRSIDGGKTFDPPRTLFSAAEVWHVYDTRITANNGNVTIGFRNQCNWCVDNTYLLLNSSNSGDTFVQRTAYSTKTGSSWSVSDMQRVANRIYVLYHDAYYYYGLQYDRLYLATSLDEGVTFDSTLVSVPSKNGEHKTLSLQEEHYVPKLAISGDVVSVVWAGLDDDDTARIFYRRSLDGGLVFGSALNLSEGTVADGLPLQAGQATVVARGTYVYTAWVSTNGRLFLRRSTNAGAAFQPVQELTAPAGTQYIASAWWPVLLLGPNDASGKTLHVYWCSPTYLLSVDGGATFTSPALVMANFSWKGTGARQPQLAVGADGVVHFVLGGQPIWYSTGVFGDWNIFYRRFEPAPAPAATDMALSFVTRRNPGDGSGDERFDNMQIRASADVNFEQAMTVEAWIRPQRDPGTEAYFLFKAEPGAGGAWGSYMLGQWRDGRIDGRIATTSNGYVVGGGDPLASDVWSHVAMTYDAGVVTDNFRLYVNGALAAKMTATGTLKTGGGILFVGGDLSNRYVTGVTVDELRFWNYARSEAQIRGAMFSSLLGSEVGLTAYYPFDNTTRDLTGHGNDGVLMYREAFVNVPAGSVLPGARTTVTAGAGGSLHVGDRGLQFGLEFPPQAVITDTRITYTGLGESRHPFPAAIKGAGSFLLEAATTTGQPEFRQPGTLTIGYTDAYLAGLGIADDRALDIVFWDGSAWASTHASVNTGANRITAELNHFSDFALVAGTQHSVFLPTVRR